jgi:hypothetical protein
LHAAQHGRAAIVEIDQVEDVCNIYLRAHFSFGSCLAYEPACSVRDFNGAELTVPCKFEDDRRQSNPRIFDRLRIIAEIAGDRSPDLIENFSEHCQGVGLKRRATD